MKRIIKLSILILVVVAIVLQCVSIYLSNTNAITSVDATKLSAQIENLSEENMQLETKVLALSSMTNVASRAAVMGYSDSRDIVSLYDPVQVASAR